MGFGWTQPPSNAKNIRKGVVMSVLGVIVLGVAMFVFLMAIAQIDF